MKCEAKAMEGQCTGQEKLVGEVPKASPQNVGQEPNIKMYDQILVNPDL